jgi:FixJ family two-component response regulator
MPKMSGLEALAILRQRWPKLPVVIISGFSRSGVPALQGDPATQFLEKPFSSEKLLEVLSTAMGGAASLTRR